MNVWISTTERRSPKNWRPLINYTRSRLMFKVVFVFLFFFFKIKQGSR